MEKQSPGSGSEKTQLQQGAEEEGKCLMLGKRTASGRDGDFGSDERERAL